MCNLLFKTAGVILLTITPQSAYSSLPKSLSSQVSNLVEAYPNAIPVKVKTISLAGRAATKVTVVLENLSDDDVAEVQMMLVTNRPGAGSRVDYKDIGVDLTAHSVAESSFYLDRRLPLGGQLIVTISKAIGHSGVWTTDNHKLESALAVKRGEGYQNIGAAHYEANINLSGPDKVEIAAIALEDIFHSRSLRNIISFEPSTDLIISTENFDSELPAEVGGYKLVPMNPAQILKEAEQKGKITLFRFYPFVIEGIKVRVILEYSKILGKGGRNVLNIPCCGGFVFEFHKVSRKWVGKYVGNEIT
ncbi:MAG: hypothetical protein ACJ74Q_14275 [Pyrinomonadaceae bacterium]